jgi:NADH-quinone oxidoreductase subunit A
MSRERNIGVPDGVNATVKHRPALRLLVHCAKGRKVPLAARIRLILRQIGARALRRNGAAHATVSAEWASPSIAGRKGSTMSQSLTQLLLAYLPLIVFVGVAGVIGLALLVVAFIVAYKEPNPEKLSAYECGFNAFDDARMKFDVRFYLVAILFIIFDLEVSFLFPWAVAFGHLGVYGFWSMMLFLGVLTIGFIYEWKKGALEWD